MIEWIAQMRFSTAASFLPSNFQPGLPPNHLISARSFINSNDTHLMAPAPNTISQITTSGRVIQEKKPRITIKDVLEKSIGPSPELGCLSSSPLSSLYVHVPFCFHKCHYCDFYSIVDSRDRQEAFTERIIAELQAAMPYLHKPLETVFVGGGTPSLLKPELWQRLRDTLDQFIDARTEFTVEANPETVTPELLQVLTSRGASGGAVNRVSIGCQSFNLVHLKTLERWHEPSSVHRSVQIVRDAGIENVNLDLIFGIPGQSLDEWLDDLDQALARKPAHMSCYGLTFEPNTAMTRKMKAGDIEPIDQDVEAAMYQATIDRLASEGFEHYEISNWARRLGAQPQRCLHNMSYWENKNWWPVGPSASGHWNGWRWKNVPRLAEYLECGPLPWICDVENVDDDGQAGERMMLGLRLIEGIPSAQLEDLLKMGKRGRQRRDVIDQALQQSLLERNGERVRFTRSGLLQADSVIAQLI